MLERIASCLKEGCAKHIRIAFGLALEDDITVHEQCPFDPATGLGVYHHVEEQTLRLHHRCDVLEGGLHAHIGGTSFLGGGRECY